MSTPSEQELAMREALRGMYPGISEQDVLSMAHASAVTGDYTLGPDSLEREGVAKGTLVDGSLVSSIYPNSNHEYKVYLPANYDPAVAYPFTIFLDGISYYLSPYFNAHIVMDNLIADGRIPAMIGIFVEPGDNGEGMPIWSGEFGAPRSNRSKEYDSADDVYSRFLLEELLPEISKSYKLTDDPDLRCICGDSSAGQAAFSAAWHRPDAFRKVISHVGSFTNIRMT